MSIMIKIIFSSETRQFSFEQMKKSRPVEGKQAAKGRGALANFFDINREATGAALGLTAGGLVGNLRARRLAKKRGIEKGSTEYRRMLRNQTLTGAGVGAVGGAAIGHLSRPIEGNIRRKRLVRSMMDDMTFKDENERNEYEKSLNEKYKKILKGGKYSLGYNPYSGKNK